MSGAAWGLMAVDVVLSTLRLLTKANQRTRWRFSGNARDHFGVCRLFSTNLSTCRVLISPQQLFRRRSELRNKPFVPVFTFDFAMFLVPFTFLGASKSDSESFPATEGSLESASENAGS